MKLRLAPGKPGVLASILAPCTDTESQLGPGGRRQQRGTGTETVRDREMGTERSNDTRRSEEQLEKGAGTETTPKLGQNQGRTEGEGPSQGSRARPGWGRPLEEVTNRHNPKSTLSQGREKAARRGQAPPWVLPAGLCCPLLAPAAVRRQEEKSETQLL